MKKKFKKITSVLLSMAIGVSVIFSGCANEDNHESSTFTKKEQSKTLSSQSSKNESSQNETTDDYTPAMWKVTKDKKEMYLFGSIHATDNGAENIPDYVQKAFDKSDYLAVEIDINNIMNDFTQAYNMLAKMLYTDGTTIKDHISKETYDRAVKFLKDNGQNPTIYNSYKPMMWISLLESVIYEQAGIDINNSMEKIMSKKAKDSKKEILEVESVDSQLAVFDNISDKLADYMIKNYTADGAADELKKSAEALYEAWRNGKPLLDDNEAEEIPDNLKNDYKKYNKAMLTDRNVIMADKAEIYMKENKKVFFMVGAAHMYGDDGIVSLLQQRGYKVEKINKNSLNENITNSVSETTSKAA